ncbi:HWE histidine kinase domain-containing protein [uncultured Roseobacter sp.]|uniref:HWE histidine kinase domain-containing protein n=1 Tax=uncultured Roseobacter sp. TaxID=114847 RepID=UPI0026338BFD|nr:HWE histidine kinase domain-containing protein [uncultured Roseobacter sp.]
MSDAMDDAKIREALAECEREPIHIPGIIQPIGYLLGVEPRSGEVLYASANCAALFRQDDTNVMGRTVRDLLGAEIWHACLNNLGSADSPDRRQFAGVWQNGEAAWAVHMTHCAGRLVLEIEDASETPSSSPEMLLQQAQLVSQIQTCTDEQSLFRLTVRLLRHLTGFDRVMIYRFDAFAHGEVLAEERRAGLESFEGLHFPKWDIPKQARDIMCRVPLRLIANIADDPVPILQATADLPPLDISLAQLRGVSKVHLQYLRNMGSDATMTLSVVLDGDLWGIISFHHMQPKVSPPEIRQMLADAFLPVFCLKLNQIRDRTSLKLARKINGLQTDIQAKLDKKTEIEEVLEGLGQELCEALNITGLAIISGARTQTYGQTPSEAALAVLVQAPPNATGTLYTTDALRDAFPDHRDGFGDLGGALVIHGPHDRRLAFFRPVIEQSVAWAGNPTKALHQVDGNARLEPRGSFATYLESIEGQSEPWSPEDQHLAQLLWPLLNAAERQAFMNDLSRQQMLMIGELNHRVRNILTLIESVSRQARRSNSSLESYSKALEARIKALAAAHDLGAGSALPSVSVRKIIELENTPYGDDAGSQLSITGPDFYIRADLAPTFTLAIHELMTNAVKYGALSTASGRIAVALAETEAGMELTWVESGGPPVVKPDVVGFGSILITQAIAYELGGSSDLDYAPSGVRAHLTIPHKMLDAKPDRDEIKAAVADETITNIPAPLRNGIILILEDNFVIANGIAEDLKTIGFPNSEIVARAEEALDYIGIESPALGLLDINLGGGQTSIEVARKLAEKQVPFVFVSGYGELADLPADLDGRQVLTKPASREDLIKALAKLVP